MNRKWMILLATMVLVLTAGGRPAAWAGAAGAAGVAATQPGPIATINGEPIDRAQFSELLIEAEGKLMLEFVVALEVVKQEARAKNIIVTKADIEAEEAESIPDEIKKIDPKDRDRVLDDYLQRNQLTRVHWRLTIERNAYLRKLASNVPAPTDDQLRPVYNRQYGERVEIRDIMVRSPEDMAKVNARLQKGEAFEQVARDSALNLSKAASAGGMLPPFARDDSAVPKDVREVAFTALKEGDVSGEINAGEFIHKILFVRRIPPQNVKFEDARKDLAAKFHSFQVRIQMNVLLRNLVDRTVRVVLDPVLKQQVEAAQAKEPAPISPDSGKR